MTVNLFAPYSIDRLELKNRFVRSATWDGTADSTGAVMERSEAMYRELGRGGVGLIISGYAFVSSHGQANPGQYGVHIDDMIPGLRKLVQAAHKGDAKIALQIVHAGIQSRYFAQKGISSLAVSEMPEISRPHRVLTDEEIESIISDYAAGAVRAVEAGFDAVQLHGAHGYQMSQFLSPLYNHRTDRWGGSAENRRRFHLEVTQKVRQAIGPDFPLMIKLGVQDDDKDGLSLEEGVRAALKIVEKGIDAIEVSSGIGSVAPAINEGDPEQAYNRERATAVKVAVTVPVMAVGGIRSLEMAQDIVDGGHADLISMSRPFIREPGLIARWQKGQTEPAKCISCGQCQAIVRGDKPLECGQERQLWERTG